MLKSNNVGLIIFMIALLVLIWEQISYQDHRKEVAANASIPVPPENYTRFDLLARNTRGQMVWGITPSGEVVKGSAYDEDVSFMLMCAFVDMPLQKLRPLSLGFAGK